MAQNILSETDAKRTKIAKKEKTKEKEENLAHKRTKRSRNFQKKKSSDF